MYRRKLRLISTEGRHNQLKSGLYALFRIANPDTWERRIANPPEPLPAAKRQVEYLDQAIAFRSCSSSIDNTCIMSEIPSICSIGFAIRLL